MATVTTHMTAAEFEERFDNGEDMADFIDWSRASHLNRPVQKIGLTRRIRWRCWWITKAAFWHQ